MSREYDPMEHIAESLARIADALETLASTVDDGMAGVWNEHQQKTNFFRRRKPSIRTDGWEEDR